MKYSRRSLLARAAGTLPIAVRIINAAPSGKQIPVGLELYSVRGEFARHPVATVQMVAKMGYQAVEFYAPYFDWTPQFARQMRTFLDDVGLQCHSTHNNAPSFTSDGLKKAAELNKILGSTYIVMANTGRIVDLDGWKSLCDQLNGIVETLKPMGLRSGYHNHQTEFIPLEGKRPIEIIAANTPKDFMMQFDVGTCIEAGSDPVAWINSNPGRIKSIHCKDWASGGETSGKATSGEDKGYRVLFGEGSAPWTRIFEAAESTGGVEYYLIEQEGSRYPELETAERCLANWRTLRG
jgi:sugar phosphate isomerase/epimerase